MPDNLFNSVLTRLTSCLQWNPKLDASFDILWVRINIFIQVHIRNYSNLYNNIKLHHERWNDAICVNALEELSWIPPCTISFILEIKIINNLYPYKANKHNRVSVNYMLSTTRTWNPKQNYDRNEIDYNSYMWTGMTISIQDEWNWKVFSDLLQHLWKCEVLLALVFKN
jgi:hypothetical protein